VPLKGVRVTLTGAGVTQVAQTDVNGAYRFAIVRGFDSYMLGVQSSDYESGREHVSATWLQNGSCQVFAPSEGGAVVAPEALEPLRIITGSVHTNSGLPLKGVRVTLTTNGESFSKYVAQTDVHGVYRFAVPMGSYTLEFEAHGYATKTTAITLGDATAHVGVALKPQRSWDIGRAYENANAHYCKTATPVACAYYMGQAANCTGTALGAGTVYQGVIAQKKSGFSSAQVQAQWDQSYGSGSDKAFIAAAALKTLDEHERYDPGTFAMAVMRVCLAGIAK
jgi:hypothetical protein